MEPTDCQTLIARFDVRIATHIAGIIAIVFGAFTVLPFLEGKINLLFNLPYLYIFLVELIGFPFGILYCASRSTFYSRAAEVVKAQSNINRLETDAYDRALETEMPYVVKKILKFRYRNKHALFYLFLPTAWVLWILLIFAVLFH
jgi:hypothetical protein